MDWEQLTIIAQIATGVATLAVAVFLASQLRIQHKDSERDFAFAFETGNKTRFFQCTEMNPPVNCIGKQLLIGIHLQVRK